MAIARFIAGQFTQRAKPVRNLLAGIFVLLMLVVSPAGWAEQGDNGSTLASDLVIQPGEVQDCQVVERGASESENLANSGCCKICTTGKACGDSCISRSYNCTKGRGCACDG